MGDHTDAARERVDEEREAQFAVKHGKKSPQASADQLETEMVKSAKNVQIGGSHYKHYKIQPVEFIHANDIPFMEANIIKYVMRHKGKNGLQDLEKARHYLDMLMELEYLNSESTVSVPEVYDV